MECPKCGNENVASVAATLSATKVGQALRETGERSSNIGYAARDAWLVGKHLKPPKKPSAFWVLLKPKLGDRYRSRLKAWEKFMYCGRCQSVFNPETGKSVPVQKAETLR